uniref:Homeobox domain-containing protein n=1 Tax=Rhabditophanes sp. KR3021 TaxID=114890 RepID=A0AC35TSX5_9BILA
MNLSIKKPFSIESLVSKVQQPSSPEQKSPSNTPASPFLPNISKTNPLPQTMSYFDVLLPHVQMACSNPLLFASGNNNNNLSEPANINALQQRMWGQHWLEFIQHSMNSNSAGNDMVPGLFLHPLKKTKRHRTAFTPSQLCELEKAFQKSHYIIGNERKQLARQLSLSETQVKIFMQNRRTKEKRMSSGTCYKGNESSLSAHEDELEDKEDIED